MLWVTRNILFVCLSVCLTAQAGSAYAQSRELRGVAPIPEAFSISNGLKFIPNRGQLSDQFGNAMPEVLYTLDGYGVKTYFTKGSMHYVFAKISTAMDSLGKPMHLTPHEKAGSGNHDMLSLYRVDITFVGANPAADILATDSTDDYNNYYLTSCPDGVTHVHGFRKLVYRNIYPKIDLVLYTEHPGTKDYLEYDFVVHPGGNPNAIRMSYDHTTSLSVEDDGSFHLASPYGTVVETEPNGYQLGSETSESVRCSFRLIGNSISFQIGSYDRTRDLYIDPQRLWGTFFGWENTGNLTNLEDLAADRSGNVDITGYTNGTANIATSGAFQTTFDGGAYDGFIAKFGMDGALRWATYYGGDSADYCEGIACDSSRGIAITGYTSSRNVIASMGSYQPLFGPGTLDAFAAYFDSTGVRKWGTYLRGTGLDTGGYPNMSQGTDIAIDSAQNIVAGGYTICNGFATTGAYSTAPTYGLAGFIAKFSPNGVIAWGTYLGISAATGTRVCTDVANAVYVSSHDAFEGSVRIQKFSSTGTFNWETSYFSTPASSIVGIASGHSGHIYIAGQTKETGYASSGAYQSSPAGNFDGFLAKLDASGNKIWATYYGGTQEDGLYGLVLDTSENIFAVGYTKSTSGIATSGEYQTSLLDQNWNPFMIKFDSGGRLRWGTYYGGEGYGYGVGLDPQGQAFIGGNTFTIAAQYTDFATHGAYDTLPYGFNSGFIAKFCDVVKFSIASNATSPICPGAPVTLTTKAGLPAYQWFVNGVEISGANSHSYSFQIPLVGGNYAYTVNADDLDLCSAISDTVSFKVRPVPTITVPQANNLCVGSSIKLMATISNWNGPLKYSWFPAATLDHPDSLQPIATPKQGTTYTLSVTDSNGCVTTQQLKVTFYGQPKVSAGGNRTVCSGSPVALAATETGSLPPFTYSWSPSAGLNRTDSSTVIATVTKNTTYSVTISDVNGCSSKDSLLLVVTLLPKITPGPPLSVCTGSSIKIGTNVSGGKQPYTILWTPAAGLSDSSIMQPIATPKATTFYTINVTDKNGCTAVDSVLVTVSDSLTPGITGGPLSLCTGDSAHLSAGSGYSSYLWSNGEKTPDISVAQTGDYSVHVTGSSGCSGTSGTVHVTVLPDSVPHPVLVSARTVICSGDSIQVQTTESYAHYAWSTGDTTASIFVSKTDTITIIAANAAGCSGTSAPYIISVLPTPLATITPSSPATFCSGDSITLMAANGYASYRWSTGDSSSSIVVKKTAEYFVTVTNAAGCSAISQPFGVLVNPTPAPVVSGPASICPNATSAYRVTDVSGDTYLWMLAPATSGTITNGTSANISVQWGAAGTATLTLVETSAAGCTATVQVAITISSNLVPVITANGPLAFCSGDSVTLDAGAGYTSYQWSNANGQIAGATNEKITIDQSGAYTVFVTSAGGCSGTSASTNVTMYPPPATPVITRNGEQLTSSPASLYQWFVNGSVLTDSVHSTIWPDSDGMYSVTITDSNGCISTSNPYLFSNAITAKVSVRGGLGVPGITLSIPLSLDSGTNLAKSGATTYVSKISLDRTMLIPINPAGVLVGNRWVVVLTGPVPNAPGVLQTITARAQDSALCSDITIDSFYFPGTAIGVIKESSTFCDTGTCTPLIISSDTAFTIKKIYPNPSEASFTIEYHVATDGPLSIELEDFLGRNVCQLKNMWVTAGDADETYSAQGISSGAYQLVIRSGSRAISTVLVVSK